MLSSACVIDHIHPVHFPTIVDPVLVFVPLRILPKLTEQEVADMVQSVEGTVRQIAKHFGVGLTQDDVEDLCSAGRLGAIIAARKYDDSRGAAFNTFATNWIRAYVVREVFHFWGRGRLKITSATMRMFFRYSKTKREIEARGADVTFEEVAKTLGVPVSIVKDVAAVVSVRDKSYDEPISITADESVNFTMSDVVADDTSGDALTTLCECGDAVEVRAAVDGLGAREKYVIEQRYYEGKMLREISDDLGVSSEWVRQIEKMALVRLRRFVLKRQAERSRI